MMPIALGLPGECPLSPDVEAKEDELATKRSVSTDAEGEGGDGGGANTRCAIYKGITTNRASGSKKGLKTDTTKEH